MDSKENSVEKIGFVGLGRMGKSMALNLRRAGFEMTVFDINVSSSDELVAAGAVRSPDIPTLARESDIIITMLPSSKEVELIVLGQDGVLAHARPGALIMDMSTIDPLATDRLHALAAEAEIRWVDAPVGRLAEHADRGESLFMVGAAEADFQRVKPLLDAMGSTIYHCGPVGTGGRTKLVNNFVAVSLCQINGEALALSQRFGLDITKTLKVLYGTSATNGQLRMNFPNKVLAGHTEPGFTIDLAHKDMSLVVTAAHAARVPMPVAAAVHESFSLARAADFGGVDFSCIADALCELANIEKPRVPEGWRPD
ncbi:MULTISPECIES: NAD(P)-dependent oxidoreductase [unclassified Achromobacter]|uniref:NAD(P)-dependent oxidoreductase n=1 Tax=unclassified Achromobacter TaxID=2626865 RepID=UPI000CFBA070|nr:MULTISPECIES: NAD(P)-dependent oxidoreductase [unclassified Achromobacter]PQZ60021.1 hydroxyacid dehydrogenase [Achromobacter sp. MYb9]HCW20206.1 NAD(P)-dependent oxidoreductase [Achromobacter sp.]